MMNIRRARQEDRGRILEISAQIWEGEDYIHWVIDDWLADPNGEVAVAELGGRIVAFSFRSWLFPGYAWLSGIRTDPASQGRGAGRTLTEHSLRGARREGADRVGLSTYIDNEASIHIIESYGFERIASYSFAETPKDKGLNAAPLATDGLHIEPIGADEAGAFVRSSIFLETCAGRIPWLWKMYPFAETEDLIFKRVPYWRGVREGGKLVSLVGATPGEDEEDAAFVSFLDGTPELSAALLSQAALDLRFGHRPARIEAMLPGRSMDPKTDEIPAVRAARAVGLRTWNDFAVDTYAYELRL